MDDEELVAAQRAYYRARAPEYDQWWQRTGPYFGGDDEVAEWNRQVAAVEAALARFGATGGVLELAGGTGWWTQRLASTADRLTVVDASPETLAVNRDRVRRPDVAYVVADLFEWHPEERFDVVFFSFWLSHVPRAYFERFWSMVRSCLAPGGRVFLVDGRDDPSARRHAPHVVGVGPDQHLRRLADGSEFAIVKVQYEPGELAGLLGGLGWETALEATPWFVFGTAWPHGGRIPPGR